MNSQTPEIEAVEARGKKARKQVDGHLRLLSGWR